MRCDFSNGFKGDCVRLSFSGVLVVAGLLLHFSTSAFASNYKMNEISYDFDDIASTGSVILESCDDCARAIDIGFDFTYYGRSYSQLYVASNGFVLPGGSSPISGDRMACCNARKIPTVDNLVGVMALWWTDLSLRKQAQTEVAEEKGKVLYQLKGSTGNRVLIVQYNQVRHFHNLETDAANTFQMKLFEKNHHIEFHYKKIVANQNIHAIGIESPRQDQGREYFRTEGKLRLPEKSEKFALAFVPPGKTKMLSSQRYSAQGNIFEHHFMVNKAVSDMADIEFEPYSNDSSLAQNIDFDHAVLLNNNPATFSLKYTLFASLAGETGGSIHGDIIEFRVNNGTLLELESQTVYVEQKKVLNSDEFTIRDVALNHNATLAAYRSKNNLLNQTLKNTSVDDIFFFGRDPDTQADEAYQLTNFASGQACGPVFIDNAPGKQKAYLYAMCHTGNAANEIAVHKFNLHSYLDDNLENSKSIINSTAHNFSGNVRENARVVAANGKLAYAYDAGSSLQDVYLDGVKKVNSVSGVLKSLAISDEANKLLYVLDNTAYFYDVINDIETLVDASVTGSAALSRDGSVLAIASSANLDSNNADASVEIFTHAAQAPFDAFKQMTNLAAGGECKLPQLSEHGQRLVVVCNQDLLGMGNQFNNRAGVFMIETLHGETITHLISAKGNGVENISQLTMSSDGATLSFQDTDRDNAFQLVGLSKLDTLLEENTAKDFPIPFKLKGNGKSGALFHMTLVFLALILLLRVRQIRV